METTAKISVPLSLRLSGSALKIIAILSMVADHCACFLMEPDTPMYDCLRCFWKSQFRLTPVGGKKLTPSSK